MNPRAKLASGEVERQALLLLLALFALLLALLALLARRDSDGERSRELTGSGFTGGL